MDKSHKGRMLHLDGDTVATRQGMPRINGNPRGKEGWDKSVQSLSRVRLFATLWTAACQASLSITNSRSLFQLMSFELVMPSNHLILCHPLLLLPSIFPSIRVFSNESVLCIRRPQYCSFNFGIRPSSEYSGLILWDNRVLFF